MPRKPSDSTPQLGLEGMTKPEKSWWECRGIFSTNYLRRNIVGTSEYVPSGEECDRLYEKIRTRWLQNYTALVKRKEAFTRSTFLDKTLVDLGWSFIPEESLPSGKTRKKPDYCLFLDEATQRHAAVQDNAVDIFRASATVLEAKKAQHSLDQVSETETPGWFPSQQIQDYLRWAKDDSGRFFDWAILTNGNEWRLYCEQAAPDACFAFHLADGNTFCPREDFRLFVALFRPWAFDKSGNGKCLLDAFRSQSLAHQEQLETNLRKRVFNVLEELAAGYYFNPDNQLTENDLPAVYRASLVFLYRLLFVLYAESRGLLPANPLNPNYRKRYREEYSLVRFVNKLRDTSSFDDNAFYGLYLELQKLFVLINGTSPMQNKALNVTRYNGGLFEPERHPEIDRWKVGDKTLGNVLRQLIFAQPPARGRNAQQRIATEETVDFGTLEVRQLGDIYEGLLGGRLVVRDDRLELVDEEGRNHQEGVFYTPDWVVQYLVRETLQPLVDDIDGSEPVQAALSAHSDEEKQNDSFAHGVLALNIVDPAMGSGHFLVRATEWLAEQIVYHPTTCIKTEQVVANGASQRSRDDIEKEGRIAVSPGVPQEQAETAYWRRRIVESCIFGVDLNPLAVELTKLSLWLTCIAVDAPLSFLDHHLRDGDSLIYALPEEVHRLPSDTGEDHQLTVDIGDALTEALSDAIKKEHEITGAVSTRMEVVKQKGKQWKAVRDRLLKYEDVLNLWIAALEGLQVDGSPLNPYDYHNLALSMIGPSRLSEKHKARGKELQVILADELAARRKALTPFLWRLEFPSVFYGENGKLKPPRSCGFDAVLGNPPYISTHTSSAAEWRDVLEKRSGFLDDLYVHFTKLGLDLLRTGGAFGFIVSDTFFTLDSKLRMREWLQDNRLTHLGQCDPFKATVDAGIFVLRKETGKDGDRCLFVQARYATKDSRPEKELPKLPSVDAMKFSAVTESPQTEHGAYGCLRVHRVPVSVYRNALKRAFFEPRPAVLTLYRRFNDPVKALVEEWWDSIQTSDKFTKNREAISEYQSRLTAGDITLIGLVAEGSQGLATGNNQRFLAYRAGTPQAEEIVAKRDPWSAQWLSDPEIGPKFRQALQEQGGSIDEPTTNSAAWEAAVESLRAGPVSSKLRLQTTDLYRVAQQELIASPQDLRYTWECRKAELLARWQTTAPLRAFWKQGIIDYGNTQLLDRLQNADDLSDQEFCVLCRGLSAWVSVQKKDRSLLKEAIGLHPGETYSDPDDAPRVATIYNGLRGLSRWIPFRKGDPEGNRWAENEPLYIDWSAESVRHLSTSRQARWQGGKYFLRAGVNWTRGANHVPIKAKLLEPGITDVNAMKLAPVKEDLTPTHFLLGLMNSDVFSYFLKKFVAHTWMAQISDLRMMPVIVAPDVVQGRLSELVGLAVQAKHLSFTNENPSNELADRARKLADELQAHAPVYLQPSAQLRLLETAADCLSVIELAVNWEAEKLYGVEGLGPFDEF